MSSGSLEITLVSASISRHTTFESEPRDTYASLRCTKEQHCTKHARDQGRLPVWNETFKFDLQEQDMSGDILVQVFNARTEVDELLGLARIPICTMVGKEEATLCALINPIQGEIGKVKAAWRWKPDSQRSLKASNFERKASEVQDYTGRESCTYDPFDRNLPYGSSNFEREALDGRDYTGRECTSDPFDRNSPYRSLRATNYDGKAFGLQGYTENESYTAAATGYDSKVPPYGGDSGPVAYPHVQNPNNRGSEPYANLDAVSDAMAKLNVDKGGSGRYTFSASSYLEDSGKSGKEAKAQGGEYYPYPPASAPGYPYPPAAAPGAYTAPVSEPLAYAGYSEVRASEARNNDSGPYAMYARGPSDYGYPPPRADSYPPNKDAYPPHPGTTYPPPSDAFPPNKDFYHPHSGAAYPPPPSDAFPQNLSYPGAAYPQLPSDAFPEKKDGYPPYSGMSYPLPPSGAYPPLSGAYPPSSGAYPPNKVEYPPYPGSTYPPYPDHHSTSSSGVQGEGLPYMERGGVSMEKGGGGKEKGGSGKEKDKGHGSHDPYGQPPLGYPPSSYPPYPDHHSTSSSGVQGEGLPYMERGGGSMEKGGGGKEKGGSGKEKDKGHGSHDPYGQPPLGYPPSSYPPPPAGYPPYGPPSGDPHSYPPSPHGYPAAPPPAPYGYPPAPHGYPPAPQGYPPYGYPPAVNQHSAPGHPPHGYPTSAHGGHQGHYPDKHGGAYVGHSSSSSKPSKKHKEPKHSSSHKHGKHKKQKSFKGMKFKKFKMFKF